MLEDCHINDHLLYEQHYLKLADSDVAIGGALGARQSALIGDLAGLEHI